MMQIRPITSDFEKFISIIETSSEIKTDIISKHNSLTAMIKSDPPIGYEILKSRLSGSYAKHTSIKEFDYNALPDVDVIIVIEDNNLSAKKVHSDFLDYLMSKKKNFAKNVRQQSNSIGLIYQNISVDVVIAKEKEGRLYIASDKYNEWVESNALNHVEFMKNRAKQYEIDYYGLMKIFKYLNKNILKNSLKSYTLEMLVHQCIPEHKVGQTIPQMFRDTMQSICCIDNINEIRDCYDSSKNGYDNKDVENFDKFKVEIAVLSEMAIEALTGKRFLWEKIFGDMFPQQPSIKIVDKNIYDKRQTPWAMK